MAILNLLMKPILISTKETFKSKLAIDSNVYPNFYNPWHYHEELELTLVLKSYGQRQVGDDVENFYPGDLVLVGSNLPHVWKNDQSFFKNSKEKYAQAIVVKFLSDFASKDFLDLPEMSTLKELIFDKSSFGVKLLGTLRDDIEREMRALVDMSEDELLLNLVQILFKISKSDEYRLLASRTYQKEKTKYNHRINKILDYIMENYHKNLTLDELADVVHMNKNGFCRFFKKNIGSSLFTTIKNIRISKACQQLLETEKSVLEISLDVGFNNVSNFNRTFKKITKTSPLNYRKNNNHYNVSRTL